MELRLQVPLFVLREKVDEEDVENSNSCRYTPPVYQSICSNRRRSSRLDFLSKYNIALKEARETLYWLKLLMAAEVFPTNKLNDLLNECDELVAILTTIVKKVRSTK